MTGWFNAKFKGAALTVEYAAHPSRRRMTVEAPRQLLGVLGAHRARDQRDRRVGVNGRPSRRNTHRVGVKSDAAESA